MGQGTRKWTDGKGIQVGAKDRVYIGLDVHKKTIAAAVRVNGRLVRTWSMPARPAGLVKALAPWRPGVRRVVYEAGPTGYKAARALQAAGFPTSVIAPSKTPREAGPASKSDRLDCRQLAAWAEKEMLSQVAIPTPQEEADRQVMRLREQVARKRRRVKQQIKSFLLMHGLSEPAGLKDWTQASVAALRRKRMGAELRFALHVLLDELAHLLKQMDQVKRRMEQLAATARHAEAIARLKTHPAVGPCTALAFRLELHQPERFASALQVTCYLGLAPLIRQSGEQRRTGRCIPGGRAYLRALLIQAAWRWLGKEERIRKVYGRLLRNTGLSQKAIVGVARRLATYLWTMQVRHQDYRTWA